MDRPQSKTRFPKARHGKYHTDHYCRSMDYGKTEHINRVCLTIVSNAYQVGFR